jgi:hypothetical protein
MEKVYYFTIAGDRKNTLSLLHYDRLSNYLKIIEAETFVINKMYNYREKTASCAEEDLS